MSDKQKALGKVNDLIHRSLVTDSAEESRTCAVLALQLMDKHGMTVRLPNAQAPTGLGEDIDDLYDIVAGWEARVRPNHPRASPPPGTSPTVTLGFGGTSWHIQARGVGGACDSCLKPYHAREVIAVCSSPTESIYLHRSCLNERRRYVEGQHHARGGDYDGHYWASRRAKKTGACVVCRGVILPQEVVMLRPGVECYGVHLSCFKAAPKPAPPPTPSVPFEDL